MAVVILEGEQDIIEVPFNADVRGTGAAETVQVTDGASVDFAAGAGDRVAFSQELSAYSFSQSGNTLTVARDGGATAEISLNADTELAFANGSATAGLNLDGSGVTTEIGGQAVGEGFDASAVQLDTNDTSGVADPEADGSGGDLEDVPDFPDPDEDDSEDSGSSDEIPGTGSNATTIDLNGQGNADAIGGSPATFDASGGSFEFRNAVRDPANAIISNLSDDDQIVFDNVRPGDDFLFQESRGSLTVEPITIIDEVGKINKIVVEDVVPEDTFLPTNINDVNETLGFDAFAIA